MSLRTRLIVLLTAFAAFALVAASATIYGVRLYVDDAIADFHDCMDQTRELDLLRLAAREQMVRLHEIVGSRAVASEAYLAERDAFFDRMNRTARWSPAATAAAADSDWAEIARLVPKLKAEFQVCLALAESGERAMAARQLSERVEADLWPALETRLQSARARLDAQRSSAVNGLVATNTQLLVLAALVAALGAGLVSIGAALIRRWLILPVAALKEATQRLGRGEMGFRVQLPFQDELADLGASLNQMAESLVVAQEDLHTSESKFRSLFENLRDAVLICDADGVIIEHHNGDLDRLPSADGQWRGRKLGDIWPELCPGEPTWSALLEKTLVQGGRAAAVDLELKAPGAATPVRVDLVAYQVEFGRNRYAAIVLREVSERHELQRRARQAEAMKATISFAQGIAHDFNNLLTSGISTLSRIRARLAEGPVREQAASAMRACWQAARLARKLLDFAAAGSGHPQTLRLNEAVALILNSLDESFFNKVRLCTDCHSDVLAYMDRDQLTQVVLNLVHNAREAMPSGGELRISVRYADAACHCDLTAAADSLAHVSRFAQLTVEDTGLGMSEEVRQKLFEPFFSTKPRKSGHRRGMGLAVVYAAVRNAGGVIEVESRPGAGTRFTVTVPSGPGLAEPSTEAPVRTAAIQTADAEPLDLAPVPPHDGQPRLSEPPTPSGGPLGRARP